DDAGQPVAPFHALCAGARGGESARRSDGRPAVGGIRRGGKPPARPERYPRLVLQRDRPMTDIAIPVRAPAASSADDTILPFGVAALDLRGRVLRLGGAIDDILTRHDYPVPVSKLLGEAVVLTVLLGSTLKFESRFILQTKDDGPVRLVVVDSATPNRIRACATSDKDRVKAAIEAGEISSGALVGRGHLAMTIDQGPDMSRYQGVVPLDGGSLEAAAHEYFRRSEQIP